MKKVHVVTQKASNIENFKDLMITFVSNALSLTEGEKQSLIANSEELSQQSTLPDLVAHLSTKKVEGKLLERLKGFGKEDTALQNTNKNILLTL